LMVMMNFIFYWAIKKKSFEMQFNIIR